MIDHISFSVNNISLSEQFYTRVLAVLGYKRLANDGLWIGFGKDFKADYWIGPHDDIDSSYQQRALHIAFVANTREQVNRFYEQALTAGGKDNGAPGLRRQYHENYYAAFVIDLDGHNIEAVCHSASV